MIVTVAHTKGGVGKSTLAFSLAIARGGNVWLIDGDRQATCKTAMTIRSQSGRLPLIPCDNLPDGKQLHAQLSARANQFNDVVIDAGGRDSSALRAALVLSDLVLVPFAPRSLDVWALGDMSAIIKEARKLNPSLRAAAVLSCADPSGKDNKDAVEALSDYPELIYMDSPIVRRKSFANAMGLGLSVAELTPKDTKATQELKRLVDNAFISL
jgi:chromosome partitioning protein